MTSTEERDLNGNIIENNYKKHSLNKAINNNDLYIASKYLLQPIDPAPRTSSSARKLSSEWLSDTESLFSEDEEEEKERLHKLVEERKRYSDKYFILTLYALLFYNITHSYTSLRICKYLSIGWTLVLRA